MRGERISPLIEYIVVERDHWYVLGTREEKNPDRDKCVYTDKKENTILLIYFLFDQCRKTRDGNTGDTTRDMERHVLIARVKIRGNCT
jgi:hypothetical protein